MRRLFAFAAIVALLVPPGVAPARAQTGRQTPQRPPTQVNPRTGLPVPPSQQRETIIRTAAELVLVDVQVTDRAGKPVKGLKPEVFTVLEDNKEQKVDSFDYYDIETIETAGAADQAPVVVSLGTVAPPEQIRATVRDRRMIVLFFDLTSMQPDEVLRAHAAALRYLNEQMTPADLVAAVAFGNRLSVLANLTNNRELLVRAIARIRPGKESQLAEVAEAAAPAGEETVSEDTGAAFTADETEFNIFNTDRKLAALQGIADLLRSIPGKKSVIHFAGGITQTGQENRSQLRAATDAANRANVSFYTVDTRGLQAEIPGGEARTGAAGGTAMFSGAAVFRQAGARQDSRETLATLASDTGGRAFYDLGDFGEVFSRVQQDASGYYLLGYYSTNAQHDGRWRDIKVRVDAPGVRVRHREGYYAPKEFGLFTAEDRERQLDEAMRSETPRVELALVLDTAHFYLSPNEIFVPIAVKLASSALQWAEKRGRRETEFDFAAEVREQQSGAVVAALRDTVKVRLEAERFQQVQQRAIVYQGGIVLGPGNYRIKFLARENESGQVGTFEQPLALPPVRPEQMELSSVLLSSQIEPVRKTPEVKTKALAPDARLQRTPLEVAGERVIPSVTRVFTPQQRLYVLFQTYLPPKADATKLRGGLVFFRNGARVSETPMVEPAEIDAKGRVAVFRLSLPLEKFAPGRYMVQAVVVETGGTHAAFARNYFALRLAPTPASETRPGN
jgi:VWFA-related protein